MNIQTKDIFMNVPLAEFSCYKGKKSVFGNSIKYAPPMFQFGVVNNLLEQKHPASKQIIYSIGKAFGKTLFQRYMSLYGKKTTRILDDCFQELEYMGFGVSAIAPSSQAKGLVRITCHASPIAKYERQAIGTTDYCTDFLLAGVYSGIFSGFLGGNVEVEEKRCYAMGKDNCYFESSISPQYKNGLDDSMARLLDKNICFNPFLESDHSKNKMVDRISKISVLKLEEGNLHLFNVALVQMPLVAFHVLQHCLDKANIPIGDYMYHSGFVQSIRACEYQKNKFGVQDMKEILSKVMDQWQMIGLGSMVLADFDQEKKYISAKMIKNYWLDSYEKIFGKLDRVSQGYALGAVHGMAYFALKDDDLTAYYDPIGKMIIVTKDKTIKQLYSLKKDLLAHFVEKSQPKFFN